MITNRKAPSAKNITQKDVDAYVESLGGWDLTEEQQKELDKLKGERK